MKDPRVEALETYFRLMSMNGGVQVFRSAMKAGILDRIRVEPLTADEIARRCELKAAPARLVLEALCALGLIRKSGEVWELAPAARSVMGPYRDLGDVYWSHLDTLLSTGEPLVNLDQAEQGESFYKAQAAALEWMLTPAAGAAAAVLARRAPREVLDVGAGSAVWSLTLAKLDPAVRVTALDRPGVLEIAQASAGKAGVSDRLIPLPGDFNTVEIPAARFDLAIAANVVHLMPREGTVALLGRIHRALKPDGAVAVIDVVEGSPEGGLARSLYALGLALRTKTGRTYSREDLDSCLADAGFSRGTWTSIEVAPHTLGMVVAHH
jgi:SAM-dependent methyltransferase